MKSILALIALFSSFSTFASTYHIQDKSATINYDRNTNALVIGQSQRVTVTDSNGKSSSFNRGVGTYIPLDRQQQGIRIQRGEPPVYWHGKRVK